MGPVIYGRFGRSDTLYPHASCGEHYLCRCIFSRDLSLGGCQSAFLVVGPQQRQRQVPADAGALAIGLDVQAPVFVGLREGLRLHGELTQVRCEDEVLHPSPQPPCPCAPPCSAGG